MIDVALLSVIRRWHFREGLSIREIARRTKLSRNTISKYLANGVVEPRYVRRTSPSKLDPFAEQLRTWLVDNAQQGRKRRRTVRQLHASLAQLGYEGSYGRVCAFARRWRQQRQRNPRSWCVAWSDAVTAIRCHCTFSCTGRSLPVRLERRLCRHQRRAH